MSLMDIGPIVFGPKDDLITWLRTKKLLASSQDCSFCGTAMREGHRSDVSDGVVWRCPQCKRTKSIREGSFFSKSRLPLQKWLLLIHYWSKEFPVKDAADDTEIHKNTACDMYRWLREVCSTKLLQVLGGRGVIVQIDESLFRHKVKYHHGRPPNTEIWVFGMVDVSHSPALGYMQIVPQRNAATLLPIIQQHVAPGTVIHSDQWRAYSRVHNLPNVAAHHTVNHSIEFVDSATGVHTENIESYWNRAKIKLKRMRGCHELELSSYLDKFMWWKRYETARTTFHNIIGHISAQYPLP